MIILGLTGSIGMGKSATAQMFRDAGIMVYDADAAVHAIYEPGGSAIQPLEAAFPGVAKEGRVDRIELRSRVIDDADAMKTLESIVHPLVGETQKTFREEAVAANVDMVVLDIPLLFETGGEARCDYTIVVTTKADEQRARVLDRPGMTEEAFEGILAKQVPDAEKRAKADFIINTRIDLDYARDQVNALIAAIRRQAETR